MSLTHCIQNRLPNFQWGAEAIAGVKAPCLDLSGTAQEDGKKAAVLIGGLLSLYAFPSGGLANAKIPIKTPLVHYLIPLWGTTRGQISVNGHENQGIKSVMIGTRSGDQEPN